MFYTSKMHGFDFFDLQNMNFDLYIVYQIQMWLLQFKWYNIDIGSALLRGGRFSRGNHNQNAV